jgi:hypothetical protein
MRAVLSDGSHNGPLVWLCVVSLAVVAVATTLTGSFLWAGFTLVSLGIVLVPAFLTRDPTMMPAWGVVALLTVALAGRLVGPFRPTYVYVALAALALLVAVEIDAYSTAVFTPWFAVLFVTFATLAAAGLWGVAQYVSDLALGTEYLTTRTDLMWDLVVATVVGVGAGAVFATTVLDGDDGTGPVMAG